MGLPAARVTDPFGHSSAMNGVLVGLAVGALIGVAIIATGGLGAIAVGAAIATTGGAGLAGQAIGQTIDGPETGVLEHGSTNVRINSLFATMTTIGSGSCSRDSGQRLVASGSSTVKINGQMAARVSEKMDCSAVIRKGSPNVNIGGPTKELPGIKPEVPAWLSTTMTAMMIGGTLIATGGIAAAYGTGAAVGSLVGGVGGGYLGGKGGTMAAAALGFGATGQAVGGVLGGFAGGALGGGLGFKGGAAAEAGLLRANAAKELSGMMDRAPAAKTEIDALADRVAADLGGTVAKAPIKSQSRAIEKIMNDYDGDASRIKDLARNTIIVPKDRIADAAELLKANGLSIKNIQPTTESLGYSGVNSNLKTASGITGEIQVNSPEMIYAKETPEVARSILGEDTYNALSERLDIPGGQGHTLYEEYRSLPANSPQASEIAERSVNYYDRIRGQ